jgi:ribosomal protein L33
MKKRTKPRTPKVTFERIKQVSKKPFKSYCPHCKKETDHRNKYRRGHEGMEYVIWCTECGEESFIGR